MMLLFYKHEDCAEDPDVEWQDTWDCACNSECPACGIKDIEPYDAEDMEEIKAALEDRREALREKIS